MRSIQGYRAAGRPGQPIVAITGAVAALVEADPRGIVLIDGVPGAGKVPGTTHDIDPFAIPYRGIFIDAVPRPALSEATSRARSENGTRIMLSGSCARRIAHPLGLGACLHVPAQPQMPRGISGDLDAEDTGFEPCDEREPCGLAAEVRRYHAEFRPRHAADIVFLRCEPANPVSAILECP